MKTMQILRMELSRLLRSPVTLITIALSCLSLLLGFLWPAWTTMASLYLSEQIKAASLYGALLFAALTLLELSRVQRGHMDALTDCVISPVRLHVVKLLALCCTCVLATLLAMAAYAPFAVLKLGIVFSVSDYLACFGLFVLPAQLFGCMVAATAYQLTRRVEVSALLVLAFVYVTCFMHSEQYLWQWCVPMLPALSDDFSNAMLMRMAAYNRLVWLPIFVGAWLLSLLAVRRYGRGFVGSLAIGVKKPLSIVLAVCLMLGSAWLWQNEPFFDHSPTDWMSAQAEAVDATLQDVYLLDTQLDIDLSDTLWGRLSGEATYSLRNESGEPRTLTMNLNAGYTIKSITANGQAIPFEDLHNDLIARRDIRCTLPSDARIELRVTYGGHPRNWNISQRLCGSRVISSAGIQLSGRELSPILAVTMDEGAPIEMSLRLPSHLTPVTNGYTAQHLADNGDGTAQWRAHDVGEDNITLFAADYVKVELQSGGIPVEFYYSRKHQAQIESLDATAIMEAAIQFCTERFGPREFTENRPFKIIQGSELLFGGFARQNISTMSEESFTIENLSDTNKGASGAEVLAHEIIHQWWGLGIMFMDDDTPFWSSEGLTTYTTYRLMKSLRGAEYADSHYKSGWEAAVSANEDSFYVRNPEYRDRLSEAQRMALDTQLAGVNEYDGYALMFDRAATLLGGEDQLDAVLSRLYREGGADSPMNITLNDFLAQSGLSKEALGLE